MGKFDGDDAGVCVIMSSDWFSSPAGSADGSATATAASSGSWFGAGDESAAAVGGLSYRQRLTMFVSLFGIACIFFFLASMSIIMPVKFAKLFFLGSFFLISSSAFQRERIVSTLAYLGSAGLTMVSATHLNSTLVTMVALGVQFFCAGWLALSYLPFGQSFLGIAARQVLPI